MQNSAVILFVLLAIIVEVYKAENTTLCGGNSLCLPEDYIKSEKPTLDLPGPMKVVVRFYTREVVEINDHEKKVTLATFLKLEWPEPRLIINRNSSNWRVNKDNGAVFVSFAVDWIDKLWMPDIEFYNLINFRHVSSLREAGTLRIYAQTKHKDRNIVSFMIFGHITVDCGMKFRKFPMDNQRCVFKAGSASFDNTSLHLDGAYTKDGGSKSQRKLQHAIHEYQDLDEDEYSVKYSSGEYYSVYGFAIILERTFLSYFLRSYLPAILFVIISWSSFVIDPHCVPGRMSLLITLLLVMVNLGNSSMSTIPTAEGLTALEVWLFSCLAFVSATLVEYAGLLYQIRYNPGAAKVANRSKSMPAANSLTLGLYHAKLDKISLIVFPLTFALFNLIYWVYYKLID